MSDFEISSGFAASTARYSGLIPTEVAPISELLYARLECAINGAGDPEVSSRLRDILYFSPFIKRVFQRYPDLLLSMAESGELTKPCSREELFNKLAVLSQLARNPGELETVLRRQRHVELARIAWREYSGISSLEKSIGELSNLADGCLRVAHDKHRQWLDEIHGCPIDRESGEKSEFVIFALGKLGGEELNFSSDVDLVFAYSSSGQTDGAKPVSNNEYFIKLGQAIINTLNTVTDEGFVYRVDMRLRPNGQSGPLAMPFSAMENYYQIHGREWERYAWIKARPVAGNITLGDSCLRDLRPFIYRKYLDYQVYRSLNDMKLLINKEIRQQGMQRNIKLGRGGIREIEFIAQSHQLVRGGRDSALRTRSLKHALKALGASGQINQEIAARLYQAYTFLRTVEHRLQMRNDEQTHSLPVSQEDSVVLAASMGLSLDEFTRKLEAEREFVHQEFNRLHNQEGQVKAGDDWQLLWNKTVNQNLGNVSPGKPDNEIVSTLASYAGSKSYRSLETRGRRILDSLIPKILQLVARQPYPAQALNRLLNILSSIGGRSSYLSLLDQFPAACSQLVQLCAASPWISQWISDYPIVLDTLINPRTDLYTFNRSDFENMIEARISDESDVELKHDILRQIHHSCLLQTAIADMHSQYGAREIREIISRVAQAIIGQVIILCQQELDEKFGRPAGPDNQVYFGVIAYGKLGSGELSYNADLDLVFVYDDTTLESETREGRRQVRVDYYFSRLVQRILTMLSMQTSAGKLYDVDTRLRPSGRSGLLVSSFGQFEKYQHSKAWVWEHQALVKARMIGTDSSLKDKFNRLRHDVLVKQRDSEQLATEITAMRERMRVAADSKESVRIKSGPGGMVDIEFLCQYLVLSNAFEYPEIAEYRSVADILEFSGKHRLVDSGQAVFLAKTWIALLELENNLKLSGKIDSDQQSNADLMMIQVQSVWHSILD